MPVRNSRESILNFLTKECEKIPLEREAYTKRDGTVWLRCPYHSGGQERTPSFKINLNPSAPAALGSYYCFSCHVKGAWNTFAALFGLKQLKKAQVKEIHSDDTFLRRRDFSDQEAHVPDLRMMAQWSPVVDWRTIPGKTICRFGGRRMALGRHSYLYLPVMVYGEHVGGIQAILERDRSNKKQKAYINTDGTWSHSSLFGFDQAMDRQGEPLWIVEGPRDALWINTNGGRVVGLIGSAFTNEKAKLILDLDPPCILVATDGDDAGNKTCDDILNSVGGEIPCKVFPFKEGEDPCNLTEKKIEKALKSMNKFAKSVSL